MRKMQAEIRCVNSAWVAGCKETDLSLNQGRATIFVSAGQRGPYLCSREPNSDQVIQSYLTGPLRAGCHPQGLCCLFLGSISPTCLREAFMQNPKRQSSHQCLVGSSCAKAACKLLAKLTTELNFINVLPTASTPTDPQIPEG
jgi:hypothetical protein